MSVVRPRRFGRPAPYEPGAIVSSARAWRIWASCRSRWVASGVPGAELATCDAMVASCDSSSAREGGGGAALGPLSLATAWASDFSESGVLTCGVAWVAAFAGAPCAAAALSEPATTSRPFTTTRCGRWAWGGLIGGAGGAGGAKPVGAVAPVVVPDAKGDKAAIRSYYSRPATIKEDLFCTVYRGKGTPGVGQG